MANEVQIAVKATDKTAAGYKSAEDGAKKLGGVAAGVAKAAAVGLGAVAVGVAAIFKTGIDEQSDFLKGQAQLQAGLKSTGGAAGETVDHMENLASSIQDYSGQTDDSIVATESLLLTFTNIKNQAGKTNDVFDQTVKISADMAARMGGDATSSAIQLGKALNDPTQGITALTRVGVSFTDGQKKQIAALQKSGNMLGAQKIILGELNKEFGGSAKAAGDTLPGQLARGRRAFEDISQSVLSALMPVLLKLGTLVTGYLIPALGRVVSWTVSNWPRIQAVIVKGWKSYIQPAVMAIVNVFRNDIIPAVASVINYVVQHWPAIQKVIVAAWTNYIRPALAAYVDFILHKVWPAVGQVVKFIVDHWPEILKAIKFVWDAARPTLQALGQLVLSIWHSVIQPMIAWVKAHWSEISTALKIAVGIIAVAFKIFTVALTTTFNLLALQIRIAATIIGAVVTAIVATINGLVTAAFATKNGVVAAFNAVVSFFTALPGRIAGVASTMWSGVTGAATTATKFVTDKFGTITKWISDMPGKIAKTSLHMFDGIAQGFKAAINFLIGIWNKLHFHIPGFSAFGVTVGGFDLGVPTIPKFAKGGIAGGLAEIGEHGREVVRLPNGSHVMSNPDSERMLAGGGAQTVHVVLEFTGSDAAYVSMMRKAVRVRGGNVQIALGRN